MYKINFEKIKQSSTDFKGKDWLTPREIIKGVHWDISDIPLEDDEYYIPLEYILEMRADKYKHLPIVCIDESIRDHMTQILFILKENFTDYYFGFTGWKSFSKESLITLCKEEYDIYNDWPNGNDFVLEFPDKINTFIESYCDDFGPERYLDRRCRQSHRRAP